MALQPCRECGKEISTTAANCPHCGMVTPTTEVAPDSRPCPKCGSAKTTKYGPGLMGFLLVAMSGCFLWIPVVGWVLAPILLIGAIGMWLTIPSSSAPISFKCDSCNHWFTVPKNELTKD